MSYLAYANCEPGRFFGTMLPEDEQLHALPADAPYDASETSMFGFNIPEHGIDCIVYFWHRPVLKVTYGGIMIWRGLNGNQAECEYSDYRSIMPLPADITDCTYANGVRVRMVEPMTEFQIDFSDPSHGVELDLRLRAIMPPACRSNGNHLTQAMKTSGSLKLGGERFAIDGFHSRDRSWGEARSEVMQPLAPVSWCVGIVDESFAFHHVSLDEPGYHPEWAGKLVQPEQTCLWGYVREDGQTWGVRATRHHTDYLPGTTWPIRASTILEAENGKIHTITGRPLSSTQIQAWPNMNCHFVLMEWNIDGRIGYGDVQMGQFRNAIRQLTGKADGKGPEAGWRAAVAAAART